MKALVTTIALLCGTANAGFIDTTDTQELHVDGYWTVQGDHHEPIAFLPGPADVVFTRCCGYGFGERFDASPATMEAGIEALYPGLDLLLVSDGGGTGVTSGSINSAANVYSIKYGDDTLIFGYDEIQDGFHFGFLPHGWSNYLTWTISEGGFTPVTAPGVLGLLGLGLIGLLVARKQA